MADGDDDLVIGDDDELGGLDGKPLPEEQRQIPPTVESVSHDDQGNAHRDERVESHVWAKAYHNLPGFEQPAAKGERPKGLMIGESGWIPNDEEGVRAVELGFAELIDAPPDAPPMPKVKAH